MTFSQDIVEMVKYAFSWLKDKKYWNAYAIFGVLYFFLTLFDARSFATLFGFGTGIILSIFIIITVLAAFVFLVYYSFKLIYDLLAEKFPSMRPFGIRTFIGFIVTSILAFFACLFSVFELKWLLLLVGSMAFGVGAFLSISNVFLSLGLGLIAGLLAFSYFIIVVRNFARLTPVSGFYLQGKGVIESMKDSWLTTSGKALKIGAVIIIQAFVVGVISVVQLFPTLLASIGDVVFTVIGIPLRPLTAIVSGISSPAIIMTQYFFYVALFAWIVRNTKVAKSEPIKEKKKK